MITITREQKFKRQGWYWMYSLVGPDGYHSTEKNLPVLCQMAEKRYPGVEIIEKWQAYSENAEVDRIVDDTLAPWRDVVQAAIDLVNAKRHDLYVNIQKAEKRLEESVDQFISDGHMD